MFFWLFLGLWAEVAVLVDLYPTGTHCAEEYEVYAQRAVFLLLWIHYYDSYRRETFRAGTVRGPYFPQSGVTTYADSDRNTVWVCNLYLVLTNQAAPVIH